MIKKTAFLVLLIGVVYSRTPYFIHFNYLTTNDGLSQNSINCIVQDAKGYIWIGTQDGLNRYDGYEFKVYKADPAQDSSLRYTSITTLSVDKLGNLWFGSDVGLYRMYEKNGGAIAFEYIDSCKVVSLLCDSKNQLWIGTAHGLKMLNADKIKSKPPYTIPYVIPEKCSVTCLEESRDGHIWTGTVENGIIEIIPGIAHVKSRRILASPQTFKSNHIQAIHEDRDGFLWIATLGGGVSIFDPVGKEFTNYVHNALKAGSLPGNDLLSLLEDAEGRIWVGTANCGLCLYNPEKDSFITYPYDNSNANSISNAGVVSLFQDRSGTYWIGTNGGGLNYFNLDKVRFIHNQISSSSRRNKYKNCIWSIAEKTDKKIYLGTNQGIYCRSVNNNSPYLIPPGLESMSKMAVHALHFSKSGILWIGTLKNGLFRYEEKKKELKNYRRSKKGSGSFPSDIIYSIYEDRQGILWIGSNGHGLIRFDPRTERAQRIRIKTADRDSIGNWVVAISPDKENTSILWLASWYDGLIRFDKISGRYETYRALQNCIVLCLAQVDRDHLYMGTYGNGLLKFDLKDHTITAFTEKEGLSNNVVYSILADSDGCLWMGTNQGLSQFNIQTESFINYDETDGLQDLEFNLGAALKTRDGRLLFGGVNGFNSFYPGIYKNTTPPQTMVSLTTGAGKTITFSDNQEVELPF